MTDPPASSPADDDPFAGLETVADALHRLRTECETADHDREAYRAAQNEVWALRSQRAVLYGAPEDYEPSALSHAWLALTGARRNAHEVGEVVAKASWWRRRRLRRQHDAARHSERQAHDAYIAERNRQQWRLDSRITYAEQRLAGQPAPDPAGGRDNALVDAIGWLEWEVTIGNSDQPTIEALNERCRQLNDDPTGWAAVDHATHHALTRELQLRLGQRTQARASTPHEPPPS